MKRREFLKSTATAIATTALGSAVKQGDAQSIPAAARATNPYPLGPDSKPQSGVPTGKLFNFMFESVKFFAGTRRKISVYIPEQYTEDKPACIWLCLDALSPTTPTVLDNLIYNNEIPVLIAIGLAPGEENPVEGSTSQRFNRSFEFDSMTGTLGHFVLEEVLPAVQSKRTPGGKRIVLSNSANDRGATGGSTGGIGAFNLAWHHPDAFRRVYSTIGTFVGMRGGDQYPVLVRKTEPKPLRVFLQDGDQDGWPGGLEFGDWWMGNQEMERALSFAGYEVDHAWGTLGHNGLQGEHLLPDVLRWLWKDWPRPIEAGQSKNSYLHAILKPENPWELVAANPRELSLSLRTPDSHLTSTYTSSHLAGNYFTCGSLACDRDGTVYVRDPSSGNIFRIGKDKTLQLFVTLSPGDHGIAFGSDGRLYAAEAGSGRIVAYNSEGEFSVCVDNVAAHQLTVANDGSMYLTEAETDSNAKTYTGKIWLVRPGGSRSIVAEGILAPSAISLSPDGQWLFVAEGKGRHGYSFQVKPNGDLQCGEPFYWFHMPAWANNCACNQVAMDRQGTAYAATNLGVQVFDRNGRVRAILPVAEAQITGICFGDKDFGTLYVSTGVEVYRRRIKIAGKQPWEASIEVPFQGAG